VCDYSGDCLQVLQWRDARAVVSPPAPSARHPLPLRLPMKSLNDTSCWTEFGCKIEASAALWRELDALHRVRNWECYKVLCVSTWVQWQSPLNSFTWNVNAVASGSCAPWCERRGRCEVNVRTVYVLGVRCARCRHAPRLGEVPRHHITLMLNSHVGIDS